MKKKLFRSKNFPQNNHIVSLESLLDALFAIVLGRLDLAASALWSLQKNLSAIILGSDDVSLTKLGLVPLQAYWNPINCARFDSVSFWGLGEDVVAKLAAAAGLVGDLNMFE